MRSFPFFTDISGWNCLVVGGGKVAQRKVEKIQPFGPQVTVCAPVINEELCLFPGIKTLKVPFSEQMLDEADMVIAATDNPELNHKISGLCRERKIPVNVVDDREFCSFVFPALITRGSLTIGVSTGGASPLAARKVKEIIERALPDHLEETLEHLESIRPAVKKKYATEKERMEALDKVWDEITEKYI